MAGKLAGRQNRFQHVYMTSGFVGSLPRELQEVRSWTENVSTGTTPDPQVGISGRRRQLPPTPGATSFTLNIDTVTGAPDYQTLVSGRTVGLSFASDEIELQAGGEGANAAINKDTGAVTFGGNGAHATDGAVHDAIQIAGKDYWIISITAKGSATEVSANLAENDVVVWVGADGLAADVNAAAYKVVAPETASPVNGTGQGPKVGDSPDDSEAIQQVTVTFTPSAGIAFKNSPAGKQPDYATS